MPADQTGTPPHTATRKRRGTSRWISPLVLLLLWELLVHLGIIPQQTLAAPSTVLGSLYDLIVSGELQRNLMVSFARIAIGLGIGVSLGTVLALFAGLSRAGEAAIDPLMQIKRTIPAIALMPLLIVWLGIGEAPKIALIAFATVFPVYLNLYNGIRAVDVRVVEMGRAFGLSASQVVFSIVLPAALPAFLVGFRFALSISIMVLIIAEQINAASGLGYLVNSARDYMRTDIIVVCLLIYAGLGLGFESLLRGLERKLLRWRPSIIGDAG